MHELAVDTFGGAINNNQGSDYGQTLKSGGDSNNLNSTQKMLRHPHLKLKLQPQRSPSDLEKNEGVEYAFVQGQHI